MGRGGKAFETAHHPDVQGPEEIPEQYDQEQNAQQRLIGILISTVQHFFGSFRGLFAEVTDVRNPNKVTYPLASLAFSGMLIFLFRIGARRQVGLLLRNGPSVGKLQALFGVASFPHGDTMDDAYAKCDPEQVQNVVSSMTEILIRQKVLYLTAFWRHSLWSPLMGQVLLPITTVIMLTASPVPVTGQPCIITPRGKASDLQRLCLFPVE